MVAFLFASLVLLLLLLLRSGISVRRAQEERAQEKKKKLREIDGRPGLAMKGKESKRQERERAGSVAG